MDVVDFYELSDGDGEGEGSGWGEVGWLVLMFLVILL